MDRTTQRPSRERGREEQLHSVVRLFGQPDYYGNVSGFRCSHCRPNSRLQSNELWIDPLDYSDYIALRCFRHMKEIIALREDATVRDNTASSSHASSNYEPEPEP
jgi:hypothetical protein